MIKNISLLLFIFITPVISQINFASYEMVQVDSMIFQSEQKPLPYLFGNLIDSTRSSLSRYYQKESEKREVVWNDSPFEKPKLFGLKNDKVISLKEYLNSFNSIFPDSCILYFEVDFNWQGNITEAKLKWYKGKLNLKWDFNTLLYNLKAIPQKYCGIPLEHTKMIIPIRKK